MAPVIPVHQRLEDAVLGLSGIVGFLLLPTLLAYVRLLADRVERRRALAGDRGVSGWGIVRVVVWTTITSFFLYALVRAAAELRDLQFEAPVLALALRGGAVGMGWYVAYSAVLSVVRRRKTHRAWEHRMTRAGRLR